MIFLDEKFVDADLALRRGGHVNRDNFTLYNWVQDNFDVLSSYYANFGCRLRQHPDGFFFLVISGQKLKSRVLPMSCVHLGIFLALKARDPEITKTSGRIAVDQLLQDIETTVPAETLQKVYAPRARESQVGSRIHDEIAAGLKILADLKFIEIQNDSVKPLESIARFAEFARHDNEPDETALALLEDREGVVIAARDEEDTENPDTSGEKHAEE